MSIAVLYDVPAPAKLNLFLHVIGRRPDGYHLLQSVFVLIDWCDTLHFERRNDGRLQRHDLGPALPADDLSLRAARALQQASGTTLGADLSVLKNVPWGAGLGGGSSDAASTLLALNRLWGLHWSRTQLQKIALPIGADVPFFVGGHNAVVEGIGEQLTPLPVQAFLNLNAQTCPRYAVVKPAASITTAAIFGSPLLVRNTESAIVTSCLSDPNQFSRLVDGFGRNDLQPPAEASCSEVTQAAAWLTARFGNSRMSGSGSAVFARVSGQNETNDLMLEGHLETMATTVTTTAANTAAWPAEPLPPGWTGRMCRGMVHHPLLDWAS